jgi:hypothetical protein
MEVTVVPVRVADTSSVAVVTVMGDATWARMWWKPP